MDLFSLIGRLAFFAGHGPRHVPNLAGTALQKTLAAFLIPFGANLEPAALEHDAEKCEAVFGRHHALNY